MAQSSRIDQIIEHQAAAVIQASLIKQIIAHEAAAEKLEIKAADDHKWEAARLITEGLASGMTIRVLAEAIKKSKNHIWSMRRCWQQRIHLSGQSFNQFYNSELVRGPKRKPKPKAEPEVPGSVNGNPSVVIELVKRKVVKLELTPKEFKIFQRAINPACQATEESNAALLFIQSFKRRHGLVKEIPQLY